MREGMDKWLFNPWFLSHPGLMDPPGFCMVWGLDFEQGLRKKGKILNWKKDIISPRTIAFFFFFLFWYNFILKITFVYVLVHTWHSAQRTTCGRQFAPSWVSWGLNPVLQVWQQMPYPLSHLPSPILLHMSIGKYFENLNRCTAVRTKTETEIANYMAKSS